MVVETRQSPGVGGCDEEADGSQAKQPRRRNRLTSQSPDEPDCYTQTLQAGHGEAVSDGTGGVFLKDASIDLEVEVSTCAKRFF